MKREEELRWEVDELYLACVLRLSSESGGGLGKSLAEAVLARLGEQGISEKEFQEFFSEHEAEVRATCRALGL